MAADASSQPCAAALPYHRIASDSFVIAAAVAVVVVVTDVVGAFVVELPPPSTSAVAASAGKGAMGGRMEMMPLSYMAPSEYCESACPCSADLRYHSSASITLLATPRPWKYAP